MLYGRVSDLREKAQEYLLETLNQIPDNYDHWHAAGLEILRVANIIPTAVTSDLLVLSCYHNKIHDFNPLLTHSSCQNVHNGLLLWLQLCVMEDKLKRLIKLDANTTSNAKGIIKELKAKRMWDPVAHPSWLVFEVERMIQIRPE
eukprot:3306157-Ditylum_brightwellii.AAC.1